MEYLCSGIKTIYLVDMPFDQLEDLFYTLIEERTHQFAVTKSARTNLSVN